MSQKKTIESIYEEELLENNRYQETPSFDLAVAVRVNEIVQMFLNGFRPSEIKAFITQSYDVSEWTVDKNIKQARAIILEDLSKDREASLAEALAIRRRLRKEAIESGDNKLALEILKDEAKIQGLYDEVQSHSHTIEVSYV
jgi:ribosome-binding ATPase YchF (GTP1/OBG family)